MLLAFGQFIRFYQRKSLYMIYMDCLGTDGQSSVCVWELEWLTEHRFGPTGRVKTTVMLLLIHMPGQILQKHVIPSEVNKRQTSTF